MNFKRCWRELSRRGRCVLSNLPLVGMLVGGGICMLCGALVRALCGSPYQSAMLLRLGPHIPSPLFMTVIWALWYMVLGGALSYVLLDRRCDPGTLAVRYRGGMSYLAMLFCGFFWYPLFFACGRPVLAFFLLLGIVLLCFWTVVIYLRVYRAVAWVLMVHGVFLLWMLFLNVVIVFGR